MEKRQLNFNAPFLSARRFSSPSNSSEIVKRKVVEAFPPCRQQSLPLNKSDWECEEVTKPATVPFHWEQIPGRPKGEVGSNSHTPEEPSNTPRLPPGRVSDSSRRNSGEIPRLPPGRLSGPSRYFSGERSNDQNMYRPQVESFSFSDHASLLEKLNESLNYKDESDSESGDDAYSDALDTLSHTESWSFNYSVSGISGYQSSGVKPSGTFCIDTQTRDFMMNRFLPAAKAVVLETPKNVAKKPSALVEQPKQVKKAVSGEIKPSLKQYSSNALPYHTQYVDNVESEDEEQESRVPVKKSGKAWGILPRFCVKNALCLLNPLPAMRSKSRPPSPPTREVRRFTRSSHSGPLDKLQNACQVIHKKKYHSGLLSRDLPGMDYKSTHDSNQFMNSIDSYTPRVSPLRRYRSGNISPYRNESPKSPFREGVGFLGVPKEVESFNANKIASSRKMFKALQDVSRNQTNERGPGPSPTGDPVEKTVYIDQVRKKDLPSLKPHCSKKAEGIVDFSHERPKVLMGTPRAKILEEGRKQSPKLGSTDKKQSPKLGSTGEKPSPKLGSTDEKQSPKLGSTDKVLRSSPTPKLGYVASEMEDIKLNQSLDQESRTLKCPEVVLNEEQKLESDDRRESDTPSKSPLPPPLPKSPSESWLWRTLPSISIGNPFANSRRSSPIHSKKQGQKGQSPNTKWETIVKTSNLRHDHVRYSEELLHRTSHRQSKS